MLIRRHFRIKSLQFLYAQYLSKMDYKQVEKNMLHSIEELHYLYISLLCLILQIQKFAVLKIQENQKLLNNKMIKQFAYNSIINLLSKNKYLLEYNLKKNCKYFFWQTDENYIYILLQEIIKLNYDNIFINNHNHVSSFQKEKDFIITCYNKCFITNKKFIEFIEDSYTIITKIDLFIAHKMVCKTLKYIKLYTPTNFKLFDIYENHNNKQFIIDLYRKTLQHKHEFNKLIESISKNWAIKRISIIDLIILQMAICEFLYFPHIPPKATINEYIEITKIFCMEKSKIFVNGILDKILQLLNKEQKLKKKLIIINYNVDKDEVI
ncbi:transcription antitermination factor NusB [Blattabacterium cuenoti]|uniref:transcription antitermination factor NusB n=1 Tax=Blattabacterium cuenoti TaxID=1653831 RepID=UPI00163D22DA|nr:transcription antitermination factor NusB [Blattabacterium cuenoti]